MTAAILYDFLFRVSISFNMMFLEEIWSRNFTNLFIAPIKISEMITSLTLTAILRALIGLVPAAILAIPLFGVSVFKLGLPLLLLLLPLYLFGVTLGLLVTSGLLRLVHHLRTLHGQVYFFSSFGLYLLPYRNIAIFSSNYS